MNKYIFILISLHLLIVGNTIGQISYGGEPFFKNKKTDIKKVKKLNRAFSAGGISNNKSIYLNSTLKVTKYADEIISEYDILKSELSDTIGRSVIKRLIIESEGAYSLSLHFSEFQLTAGAKLFIYNDYKTIGSFTYKNNKDYNSFSSQAIPGDKLTIELSYPLGENPVLKLDKTYHGVKDLFGKTSGFKTSSESCNVNINCSEGDEWQIEKRSVCKATSGELLFTGVLVNTSNYDATPFVLTAMHAIRDGDDAERAIFYFGYEAENCDGTNILNAKTISGSQLVAVTDKIDFALVRLSSNVPDNYLPVFAGINIAGFPAQKSVCIHHPNGDTKKISVNDDPVITITYSDPGIPNVLENSHWLVENWEKGTTEGGSSGSPLFDENHLIIGTLSGGGDPCSENIRDNFSKITFAWNHFEDKNMQLAHWLNSSDKDFISLGAYIPYGDKDIEPIAFPKQTEVENDSVCVYANIFGDKQGISYEWYFGDDATPSVATGTGPFWVKYSEPGVKSVKVKILEDGNLLAEVVEDNFVTASKNVRIASDKNIACEGELIRFDVDCIADCTDLTYKWNFGEGAIPAISDKGSDIQVKYDTPGFKTITLEAYRNEQLVERVVKFSYLNILDAPESKINYSIDNISVNFKNLSMNADSYSWDFGDDNTSSEFAPFHSYNKSDKYKVLLISSRENCGIKDTLETTINLSYKANFKIYPNPSNDIVKLDFNNIKSGNIKYWLFNSEGKTVSSGNFNLPEKTEGSNDSGHIVTYNVSNIPAGIYYLRIAVDNKKITKKLVVGN